MKSIFSLYESIIDNDDKAKTKLDRSLITPTYLKSVLNECIPNLANDGISSIEIQEDGTLNITKFYYNIHQYGFELLRDLPDTIQFNTFPSDEKVKVMIGSEVTTLRGLPEDLSGFDIYVTNCQNLKDFGDVKRCRVLYIRDTDMSKIKRLPRAEKFIRLMGDCGNVDGKYISRISGTPKNKITIL